MKQMPMIGVTCSLEDGEQRQFINSNYLKALHQVGIIPVVLSLSLNGSETSVCLDRLDGLMLSGGNDVDPMLFGEAPIPGLGSVSPKRDRHEMALILEAYRRNMPILAICRGIQSLNVALGGTLYQDLPTQYSVDNESPPMLHTQTALGRYASHRVSLSENSPLRMMYACEQLAVNSFHHQAVKEVAPQLTVCARASDDVIEAVYDADKPFVVGVQWHPERMAEGKPLFEAFAKACMEYATRR